MLVGWFNLQYGPYVPLCPLLLKLAQKGLASWVGFCYKRPFLFLFHLLIQPGHPSWPQPHFYGLLCIPVSCLLAGAEASWSRDRLAFSSFSPFLPPDPLAEILVSVFTDLWSSHKILGQKPSNAICLVWWIVISLLCLADAGLFILYIISDKMDYFFLVVLRCLQLIICVWFHCRFYF